MAICFYPAHQLSDILSSKALAADVTLLAPQGRTDQRPLEVAIREAAALEVGCREIDVCVCVTSKQM